MTSKTLKLRKTLSDLPKLVLDAWEGAGITELLPVQAQALADNAIASGSCLVIGPTSCGKTFVGEVASLRHALNGRKCIYLVPFKALAEEKAADFSEKFGHEDVGVRVIISTADHREHDRRLGDGDFDIAILTYEKLSTLLVSHPGVVHSVGAVIVDEIQMVADEGRGAELELLLTRCRQVISNVQIIGLSAVVAELNGFDEWLDAKVIQSSHRPTPLREGVINKRGEFRYVEWSSERGAPKVEQLARIEGDDESELAINLVTQLLRTDSEQVLVFAPTVNATRTLANQIASECTFLSSAVEVIQGLALIEESEATASLQSTMKHAVAFHNADLTLEERQAVERGFRSRKLRCIVSTSTLSMGVNLPASTVVIVKPTKWIKNANGAWLETEQSVAEYRNMSGRAGRFGLITDHVGRSIIVAKTPFNQEALLNRYVHGTPESLDSVFGKKPIEILLLRCVASGLCNTSDGAKRFFLKTFAARRIWSTEEAQASLEKQVRAAVDMLRTNGLIKLENDGKFAASQLGMICASSGLRIVTFVLLHKYVVARQPSLIDLALLASSCADTGPDSVSVSLTTFEFQSRSSHFTQTLEQVCKQEYAPETANLLDSFTDTNQPTYEMVRQIKFVGVAASYIRGIASKEIETRLGASAGRVRAVGRQCSWLADTAANIAWSLGKTAAAKVYERHSERFTLGCSDEALILAYVPHALHRAERERLVTAGYSTLQKIIDTSATEIAQTAKVNRQRVTGLQDGIIRLLGPTLALEKNQAARLIAKRQSVSPLEELYAMTGTALEQAIENILCPPFCMLSVTRITKQRHAEPDLKVLLRSGGNGIVQVTAKDRPTDKVSVTKAGSILTQSPELSPEVFICIGRPDFADDAISNVSSHVANGRNIKLIPISVLAEMYVRFCEGRISGARVSDILEQETGYLTVDRI